MIQGDHKQGKPKGRLKTKPGPALSLEIEHRPCYVVRAKWPSGRTRELYAGFDRDAAIEAMVK